MSNDILEQQIINLEMVRLIYVLSRLKKSGKDAFLKQVIDAYKKPFEPVEVEKKSKKDNDFLEDCVFGREQQKEIKNKFKKFSQYIKKNKIKNKFTTTLNVVVNVQVDYGFNIENCDDSGNTSFCPSVELYLKKTNLNNRQFKAFSDIFNVEKESLSYQICGEVIKFASPEIRNRVTKFIKDFTNLESDIKAIINKNEILSYRTGSFNPFIFVGYKNKKVIKDFEDNFQRTIQNETDRIPAEQIEHFVSHLEALRKMTDKNPFPYLKLTAFCDLMSVENLSKFESKFLVLEKEAKYLFSKKISFDIPLSIDLNYHFEPLEAKEEDFLDETYTDDIYCSAKIKYEGPYKLLFMDFIKGTGFNNLMDTYGNDIILDLLPTGMFEKYSKAMEKLLACASE